MSLRFLSPLRPAEHAAVVGGVGRGGVGQMPTHGGAAGAGRDAAADGRGRGTATVLAGASWRGTSALTSGVGGSTFGPLHFSGCVRLGPEDKTRW